MDDIRKSLKKAISDQGWIYADRQHRIGNPFEWVDGDLTANLGAFTGVRGLLQYLSLFYEQYPLPDSIKTEDYDQMRQYIEGVIRRLYNNLVPFEPAVDLDPKAYIESSALVRAQDYSIICSLCPDMKKKGINHLDIGSGIGSHAVYSLKGFDSCFYSIEAVSHTYAVQRDFYRFLSEGNPVYLDLVECENFNLNNSQMKALVNSFGQYKIKHVPSWHFGMIDDNSIDLVTATWVLNEVTFSGIMWLISHCSRALKKGGYFYIRDSSKLKPLRHQINYDELLIDLGFKEAGRANVRNRIDLHGIPRAYYKDTESSYNFFELVDKCIGKFGITVHGGDYVQNLPAGQIS
ncbi:MAG: hypothetical protein KAS66_06705 [Candidatus Omnitrophica bacterium]|nr:hypothetical protein [Candidatus Omnitrophota bacterium]